MLTRNGNAADDSASVPASQVPALPDLAQAIEREHQAAFGAFRLTLEHAIRCGELLIEAKAQVAHGQWLPWIEANLTLKSRQCQGYMRIAANRDALNAQATAHLTIEGALALLAAPKASTSLVAQVLEAEMDGIRAELPVLKARLAAADTPDECAEIYYRADELAHRAHELRESAAREAQHLRRELTSRLGPEFLVLFDFSPSSAIELIEARLAQLEAGEAAP